MDISGKRVIAIVGTGSAAKTHVDDYDKIPGITIKWVVSRSKERALEFCKKPGVLQGTNDLDNVLKDDDVDIVDIAAPPNRHLEIAIKALNAGKNVIIEKPIGINIEEARCFYESYKNTGSSILVVYQYPYSETFSSLREIVQKNSYGHLLAYRLTYFTKRKSDYYDNWHGDPEIASGGVLINQGIHFVNLLMNYFEYPPMRIRAVQSSTHKMVGIEDTMHMQTIHEDGTVGSMTFSTALENKMRIEMVFKDTILWTEGGKLHIVGNNKEDIIHTPRKGTYRDLIEDYLGRLSKKSNLKMNFKESLMDLDIVKLAYKSASELSDSFFQPIA